MSKIVIRTVTKDHESYVNARDLIKWLDQSERMLRETEVPRAGLELAAIRTALIRNYL